MGIPDGEYVGRVATQFGEAGEMAAKFGRSMAKGTPQVTVLCEVASGPRIGEQMPWIGYLSGGALDRTLMALRLMGFEGNDLDTFADQRPETNFSFTVGTEEYKGKAQQKVQWINPVGATFDLKELSTQLRGKLAQVQLAIPTEADGSDVPF